MTSTSGYKDIFMHLSDELQLLNLRLLRELRLMQGKIALAEGNEAKGLFITEEEIASLLQTIHKPEASQIDRIEVKEIDSLIETLSNEIENKLLNMINSQGVIFPLVRLKCMFGLTPFDLGVLVMAIASEIDKRYEKIYGYFSDDITQKFPSIGLSLDILCLRPEDKLISGQIFSPAAPLLYFNLIHFIDDHSSTTFPSRKFRINERIKRFMLGDNAPDEGLLSIVEIYYPKGGQPLSSIKNDVKEKVKEFLSSKRDACSGKPVFWFYGKAEEEKRALVLSIGEELNLPLLIADLTDIYLEFDQRSLIKNLFREAILQSAIVFITGGDKLYSQDEKAELLKRSFLKAIEQFSWITFITAEALWAPEHNAFEGFLWYPVEFKLPDYPERKRLWSALLNHNGNRLSESEVDNISARFTLSEIQIKRAVFYAQELFSPGNLTEENIYQGCALASNQKLNLYSRKVKPHYTWDDIVLPEERIEQLKEICNCIRYKHLVYFNWGFEKKLSLGRGLNVLFCGPSGTGKTMASEIIASDLMLEIHKIDLSAVVSKYVGETEKNLNRIFNETSAGNVILFFDEADALFGKRTEIKDAHDRYANIEVNYLLQKMEEHEGIIILATNFSKNIDEAFLRRMHFTVEFPFPDEQQREIIWKRIFPKETPVAKEIDYDFLTRRLKIAGGNIKNIALSSAFYAVRDSKRIEMKHIMQATKREYEKIRKPFLKADFEPYYTLLEEKR